MDGRLMMVGGLLLMPALGDHARATTEPLEVTCGEATQLPAGETVIDPADGGRYRPPLDAGDVVDVIDNPYYPLLVGSEWRYEVSGGDAIEQIIVTVTADTENVMGIDATVAHDVVTVDGEIVEDTYDWFAQDAAGNVWYLGEDTTAYNDGEATTEGSWRAGVGGALPGIVMPALPAVGISYRQEFCGGEAEDMMQIAAIDGSVPTPAGTFESVITTNDWTPLEPDVVEAKDYAPGIGLVRETKAEGGDDEVTVLVHFTTGRAVG